MGGLLRPGQAAGPDDPPAQPDQVQLAGHRRCPPRLYDLRRVAERVAVDARTADQAVRIPDSPDHRQLHRQGIPPPRAGRSEEQTSEFQSLMRISYAVSCLKNNKTQNS